MGESFEECARREVEEETGLEIAPDGIRFLTATNSVFDTEKHYVTIFMAAQLPPGAPKPQVSASPHTSWLAEPPSRRAAEPPSHRADNRTSPLLLLRLSAPGARARQVHRVGLPRLV